MIRGLLVGLITFSVGEVFYFAAQGKLLPIHHPLLLVAFLVIGGLSFSLLGVIVAFRAKNIDQLSAVSGFILLPLLYLGGVFFPLAGLHPFWQSVSRANPMLYFINGVRYGILGVSDISWEWAGLFSLLTLLALYALAVAQVKRGPFTRW
jgi:ABC-2 type transport system permease protein